MINKFFYRLRRLWCVLMRHHQYDLGTSKGRACYTCNDFFWEE